jgi:transcription-repair coupling factor (superfamily II helicase)
MPLPLLLDRFSALPQYVALRARAPRAGESLAIAGLAGSSDALCVAALATDAPNRLHVVVAEQVPDAERWLADLEAILGEGACALYPSREGFGEVEPHAEVAGERVETLERLSRGAVRVLVTTVRAVQERTRLPQALADARLELARGATWRLEDLADHLTRIGFERASMVEDVAQFSVRGGIVDVYGFGMSAPVRLEFWGDELVEMREFDLSSQRTTRAIERVVVLPVDVVPDAAADDGEDSSAPDASRLDAGRGEDGTSSRTTLAALWPPDSVVIIPEGVHVEPELRRTWEEAAHHLDLAMRRGEDTASRDDLLQPPTVALRGLGAFATLEIVSAIDGDAGVMFPLRPPELVERDMARLRAVVADGTPTVILCDNAGQAERLEELLTATGREALPALTIGVLGGGFVIPPRGAPGGLRVLTDHEIFRRDRRIRRARKYSAGTALELVGALKPGDFVVHLEHGVGIYRGMETIFVGESTVEVVVIEYEGGDRLNVPLYRIDQVERFRHATDFSEDAPPPRLHRLGGKKWAQQRDKTRAAIHEMTHELLDLYARRHIAHRPPHHPDGAWQKQLESSFLFEDTPDQLRATTDFKRDMEAERPMDRLLVGDVGYGKTEIAVRAAFKAVQSGRQVAVLVPTTILAEQHGRTFGERLADFPIKIAVLSRFQTAKEQKAELAELKAGGVDIVIGTHRLLSPDVEFRQLGLIIVDEEHRFGVKHKERLKQLKLETDVLTLTATPIPRTLHQALAGLRDLTLMQTAPRDRSPVLTFVEPWDDGLLEEGIARELDRGGQVFVVHNRIETIEAVADHLRRIMPRARVAVGHGQMRERDLEHVMGQFVRGEVDVLVSTMIVESGLDVPNANTMFVSRADRFGLAQLYQLRGRVGRSHRRAYCYLLVPDTQVDLDAERRLKVLEHHTELGAGYHVALKDLELRGAGNLLGPEQSGFVHAVGFDLYLRMLEETVKRVQRGADAPPPPPADVSMDVPCYLPDDFIASPDAKLDLYRRLAAAPSVAAIEGLRDEVRDRFGPLPAPAEAYVGSATLRLVGGWLGIEGILVRGGEARVNFRADALPRMKPLATAFRDVQFQVDVRRVQPLSLKLTRLGAASILEGLVRALRTIGPEPK